MEDCKFEDNDITVEEINISSFPNRNGYIFPKRNIPGHTCSNDDDTYLIKDVYISKFVNKGQGTSINRRGIEANGQCFMVWPVYQNYDCNPDEVQFYVHYLKF